MFVDSFYLYTLKFLPEIKPTTQAAFITRFNKPKECYMAEKGTARLIMISREA